MLAFFNLKRTYHNVKASLYVDLERKHASITMTVNGRITDTFEPKLWEVDTVEKAEKYLSRDCGETGTFMEFYHYHYGRIAA